MSFDEFEEFVDEKLKEVDSFNQLLEALKQRGKESKDFSMKEQAKMLEVVEEHVENGDLDMLTEEEKEEYSEKADRRF